LGEPVSLLLLEGDLLVGLVFGAADLFVENCEEARAFPFCEICEVVLELAISRVEDKLTIRRGPWLLGGLREECEPLGHSGFFVVIHISPTMISLLHVSEQHDTSLSPRVSIISIPEFIPL
jgi:hypothetical protein